ncbi:MAG: hypothetical protein Q8916_04340 [Bacteroidota bacterium]|nr:hypothetical protein [Bacteroidota bacterium]MDP4229618.1 hypothetical protein [Bacteroidota bacterium]MDP4235853.1 hypothetical protein [Bacteroidota bacterium]
MIQNISGSIKTMTAILLLSFALPAFSQEVPPERRKPDPERVKQLMQKVLEVKHQKLREVLNLDDETSKKFFEQYDPAEKDMIELIKQRQQQEIKLLQLTQGDYKDADVDPTLQSIKALNQQIQDRYEKLDNSLKSVLTPRQRARLIVFEKEFNQRVREKIRQRREQWKDNHPFKGRRGNKPARPNVK